MKPLREAGLSREELATKSGVSAASLSRYINGERANPRIDELSRIAEALGVTLSWLYEGAAPKFRVARGDPELDIEWPADATEAQRIAAQQEVLEERAAHQRALIPFWRERLRAAYERRARRDDR